MAGKRKPVTPGTRFGRLIVIEDAGANRHGQAQARVKCDCGRETVVLEYKLKTANFKQWTRSCGCLKNENYLAYYDDRAGKVAPGIRSAIFAARCARKEASVIASEFKIEKATVDAVVRLRQKELLSHPELDTIHHAVLANMAYDRIGAMVGLKAFEVAWLAKGIRLANEENMAAIEKSGTKMDKTSDPLAASAYGAVAEVQFVMEATNRKYFLPHEWSESRYWRKSRDAAGDVRPHVMFAAGCIPLMELHANSPVRRDALRWLRETIAKTKIHRKELKRKHAIKATSPICDLSGAQLSNNLSFTA